MLTIHDSTSNRTSLALVLATSLFAFACGGDDSDPGGDAGSGGNGATGGTSGGSSGSGGGNVSGSGGSNVSGSGGSGGSAAGSGGASGSGGGGTLTPFECPADQPKAALISDFDTVKSDGLWGDAMTGLAGGTFRYGAAPAGGTAADAVQYEYTGGALHVSGTVAGYSGAGLYFNTCTDASAYKGIRFTIAGNAGDMAMTFQLQTNEDYPIATDPATQGMKGACDHDAANTSDDFSVCASPAKTYEAPGTGTVTVLWEELAGGKPTPTASPDQILGIQWQFHWADPAPAEYDVDITIDDVEFVE